MPFGKVGEPEREEFDNVYEFLIEASIKEIGGGLVCHRCDKFEEAGLIHNRMISQIRQADVAVVDITKLNPNVFYELGVRHALAGRVTVIIKREGTVIPFNIYGLNAIDYDISNPRKLAAAKQRISAFIRNGLESLNTDSLVHQCLPDLAVEQLGPTLDFGVKCYGTADADWQVGLITGNLTGVKTVDVWVSPENTNMQMARFYDPSISGTIRYLGAKKDDDLHVLEDTIARELANKMAGHVAVEPGRVVVTGAGDLERTHNVKRIFHAAAVFGQIGQGFRQIHDVTPCVSHAMDLANSDAADIRSILFPLLGAGQGHGDIKKTANELIRAAVAYLRNPRGGKVKQVYFLCWKEQHLRACELAIRQAGLVVLPG
jgi:O-acetyl-ADP-ribose deacetylase (regulator of RNase III)